MNGTPNADFLIQLADQVGLDSSRYFEITPITQNQYRIRSYQETDRDFAHPHNSDRYYGRPLRFAQVPVVHGSEFAHDQPKRLNHEDVVITRMRRDTGVGDWLITQVVGDEHKPYDILRIVTRWHRNYLASVSEENSATLGTADAALREAMNKLNGRTVVNLEDACEALHLMHYRIGAFYFGPKRSVNLDTGRDR